MISVSLCMIVKNEQKVLNRCLNSVHDIVDEINIVDTGSTDKTKIIAKQYTDRVFDFKWTGKFKDARNESFKYATKDYIFYMDADDVLLEEDREKLQQLKQILSHSVDSVSMYYHAGYDDYGNVTLRFRRNRLVKRDRHFQWKGDCHNYLEVSGVILNSDIAISHLKKGHAIGRNLQIYESKLEKGDTFTARDYFYYGNELRENGHFEQAIKAYTKNINMKEGWIEDKVYASIFRADCFHAMGQPEKEITSLFESLILSESPRPEACCRIGNYFLQKRHFPSAVFWYKLAIFLKEDPNRWGFSYLAYSTWYPHSQLFICYYNMRDFNQAYQYIEKALEYRQDDIFLLNKKLAKDRLSEW